MDNKVTVDCPHCGARNDVVVSEMADDHDTVQCHACGHRLASVGQLHAKVAQEAAGIGGGDLADDHVPLGGPPFGSTT